MKQVIYGQLSVTTDNSNESYDDMMDVLKNLIEYDEEVKKRDDNVGSIKVTREHIKKTLGLIEELKVLRKEIQRLKEENIKIARVSLANDVLCNKLEEYEQKLKELRKIAEGCSCVMCRDNRDNKILKLFGEEKEAKDGKTD